jgi:hypothetical protein
MSALPTDTLMIVSTPASRASSSPAIAPWYSDAEFGPAGRRVGADQLPSPAAGFGVPDQPGGSGVGAQICISGPVPALDAPPRVPVYQKPAQALGIPRGSP